MQITFMICTVCCCMSVMADKTLGGQRTASSLVHSSQQRKFSVILIWKGIDNLLNWFSIQYIRSIFLKAILAWVPQRRLTMRWIGDPAELDVFSHSYRVTHLKSAACFQSKWRCCCCCCSSVVYCVHVLLGESCSGDLNRTSDSQTSMKSSKNIWDKVTFFIVESDSIDCNRCCVDVRHNELCISGCGSGIVTVTHPQCVRMHK